MAYDLGNYTYSSEISPQATHNNHLTWRKSKQESFSDWTVTIKSEDNRTTDFYVHKVVLGLGPRCSEYFAKLFQSSHSEHLRNRSVISLDQSAAEAFPMMLDFMYEGVLKPTSDLAPALRHISNYFGVRELFVEVNKFIQKDMNANNVCAYWDEALVYNDEPLISAMIQMIAQQFEEIDMQFLATISPDKISQIIRSGKLKCHSEILSIKVAKYLQSTSYDITENLVHSLTNPKIMPIISPEEAMFYAKISEQYQIDKGDEGSSLLSRAAKAFIRNEKTFLVLSKKNGSGQSEENTSKYASEYGTLTKNVRLNLLEEALYQEKRTNNTPEYFTSLLKKHAGCVAVMGAGVESANGIYTPNGTMNGCTYYTKPGTWQGRENLYALYRFREEGEEGWYVSFWPFGTAVREIDIYSCTSTSDNPPSGQWECVEGSDPSPKCIHINL